MLFHVNMDVRIPLGTDPEKVKQLGALEHERARELQLQGKWLHLWRVVGKFANVSVFNVDTPAELHDILSSLPLYPFMEVQLTALCRHPGAVEMTEEPNQGRRPGMKTAKDLMLGYIGGTAEQSGALFADNGTLELPYLASIGLPPVMTGPSAISEFLSFLHDTLYPGFSFEDVKVHIDTPEQAFAEYHINHKSGISGKDVKQQFFGHLESADGKIKRLREAIDVVVRS